MRWDGETLLLDVRLQPRAGGNSVVGVEDDRLRIRVRAAPVDNAANEGMITLLAKELGVAKSRVRLLSGAKGRNKRVAVDAPRR
ncbi:MAG: YggU family protein, partial [Gammaproteobacteria bacterium]|nr:YggU family protein [Gammaproteobacteria bacterium]NIW87037.1 YggU family protein [Gammaproteobacteria bacterium]